MEFLENLKKSPHWEVIIRPTSFQDRKKTKDECRTIVESSKVQYRGWDYPHVDRRNTYNGTDFIESFCDSHYLEFWRFYQSCQFIHYFAFIEDLTIDEKKREEIFEHFGAPRNGEIKNFLSVFGSLYRITEIFEFAKRLIQISAIEDSIHVEIALTGTQNRMLYIGDPMRELFESYICRIPNFKLPDLTKKTHDFLAKTHEYSLEQCVELFSLFNWPQIPIDVLKKEQQKFLTR